MGRREGPPIDLRNQQGVVVSQGGTLREGWVWGVVLASWGCCNKAPQTRNNRNAFSYHSGSPKSEVKATLLPEAPGEDPSCLFQLLVAPGVPWLVAPSLPSLTCTQLDFFLCPALLPPFSSPGCGPLPGILLTYPGPGNKTWICLCGRGLSRQGFPLRHPHMDFVPGGNV